MNRMNNASLACSLTFLAALAGCDDAPAAGGSSELHGVVRGPVGTSLTLATGATPPLDVTLANQPSSSDAYDVTPFRFPVALPDGSSYSLSVVAASAGQTCAVYAGASGTTPVSDGAVKVGCEQLYEHASRGSESDRLGTFYDSHAPSIGGDAQYGEGRFVAFESSAALLPEVAGSFRQIYFRDRMTGLTWLVSGNAAGEAGNGDSFAPAISSDGLTVVFESYATNLATSDHNGARDVFVWSALNPSGGSKRISLGPADVEANSESFEPTVSGDGKVVAFSSSAGNLAPGVSGTSTVNVFRRDLTTGATTLVTRDAGGMGVGGSRPSLSEDGNRLAFQSFAATLVPTDANGLWDVFVYDHAAGTITRVSLTSTGAERNQGTESASRVVSPTISGDGRYVAYATTATNVVPSDTNGAQDVFVVDTTNLNVVRASVDAAGVQGNADSPIGQGERIALSEDGSVVAFTTAATNFGVGAGNVVMRHLPRGETRALTHLVGSYVDRPALSRNAIYVAFGAGSALDVRHETSSGLFVHYTGLGRAFYWID